MSDSNPTFARSFADRIFVALFVACLMAPTADRFMKLDSSPALAENRLLTKAPSLPAAASDVADFATAFETYWNDSFGFRRQLIRWNALTQLAFGVSPSPNVLIGTDGWLFFTGDHEIESFRGVRQYSLKELYRWQRALEARRDWLERRGIHFLFVVAPNKSTVYAGRVPARMNRLGATPLDQLMRHLAAHSKLDVLDLRSAVLDVAAREQVYARTDSHWTDRGAYAGYAAIVDRLRAWYPQMQARPLTAFTPRRGAPWSGDLSAMMSLTDTLTEDRMELEPKAPSSSRETLVVPAPNGSRRYVVAEGPSQAAPRAVVLHDSFFLSPEERLVGPSRTDRHFPKDSAFHVTRLLAEHFSHSVFSWQYAFDVSLVDWERPNVVIQEQVERSLNSGPQGSVTAD